MPDINHRRPFYYDDLEGKQSTFKSGESHIRMQIVLLMIFSNSGGQLWMSTGDKCWL